MVSLLRFNTIPVGTFFDDAAYLILAESLANFEGYRLINFSYAPVEQAFPPGWPILLAPLAAVFPGNLLLPRLLALAFSMGSIWLSDILFRPRLTETQRWLFLLLIAFNPFFVGAAGTVMSEPAYLFLSLLTLVLIDRSSRGSGYARYMWIGLGVAFFAMVVRTLGISIFMTALIALIPRKHWRKAVLVGGLLAVAGVLVLIFAPNGFGTVYLLSPTYQGHIEYLSGEILNYLQVWNFLPTFNYPMISAVVLPIFDLNLSFIPFFDTIRSVGAILLLLCVLWGFALNARSWRPTEIYIILFGAIFYMWTAYINEIQQRQLVPMIPFMSFYFISFLGWALSKIWPAGRSGVRERVLIAICALVFVVYGARHYNELTNPVRDLIVDYQLGGEWLQANLAEDEIYAVNYPRPSYLYSRRQSDFLPGNFEAGAIDAYMTERNISYVVIQPGLTDWNTGELIVEPQYVEFLVPHLEQNSDRYGLVFEDQEAKISIYEVIK